MKTSERCSSPAFAIGGVNHDPATETFDVPPFGWRCFHCNDHFTSVREARLHFGADPFLNAAACQIKAGAEGSLLKALREAEDAAEQARAALHDETSDVHRAMYAANCRHQGALQAAEELGYERGLRDGPAGRVSEVVDEGYGVWRPCSGCQESAEGYVSTKDYPYDRVFQCQPGGGCRECGGIGVVWDDTDYEAMARDMLAEDAATSEADTQ